MIEGDEISDFEQIWELVTGEMLHSSKEVHSPFNVGVVGSSLK